MSWVYFIQHGAQGAIKIGTTAGNPYARLRALQTGAPEPLRLLAVIPGDASLEHEMHEKFKAHRLRKDGEWFAAAPDLVWFINGIQWATDKGPKPEDDGGDSDAYCLALFGVTEEQVRAIAGAALGFQAAIRAEHLSMSIAQGDRSDATRRELIGVRLLAGFIQAKHGSEDAMHQGAVWGGAADAAESADGNLSTLRAEEAH